LVSVSSSGIVQALSVNTGLNSRFVTGGTSIDPVTSPATGTVTITAAAFNPAATHTMQVTATTEALIGIMSQPPLKDLFASHFLIGNILRGQNDLSGTGANAAISNSHLTRHFNAITAENHMKPSYLINSRNTTNGNLTWNETNRTITDNFVDAANRAEMAVIGHTLLWHSQNPNWVWEQVATRTGTAIASKELALTIMRDYINAVAGRYAGRIHTWDVLNEIFPDNASLPNNATAWRNSMRRNSAGEGQDANPWYVTIGYEFVFEGFLAARHADPNAILYYNDYNTDMPTRARLIRDMVSEVNNQYLALPNSQKPAGEAPGRLLIEGIGMQEHHNLGITAASITSAINMFRTLNVAGRNPIRLSVSELDIIAYANYNALSAAGGQGANQNHNSQSTNQQLISQANLYRGYMRVYIANSDIIERVSIWGITDNTSWRSRGLPLLFDHNGRAKPAYYSFVGALY
jgi:endo-1,4-beta-xylanase